MFKSFLRNIKSHKLAYSLNILGLAVAFVPLLIILCQVRYDFSFDKFHRESEKIFRLERDSDGWMPWISFPLAESFINSSPNIECGGILYPAVRPSYITTENTQGQVVFLEDMVPATPGITEVFDFNMVEGTTHAFEAPKTAMIPLSMSKAIFGEESPLDKPFTIDKMAWGCSGLSFTIVGVYKDFPNNSQLRNAIYLNFNDRREHITDRGNCNFNVYVRLNDISNKEPVERSFEQSEQKVDQRAESVRLQNISDIYFDNNYNSDPYAKKGNLSSTITMLSVAILIILIAIINFTNFSMALVPFRIKGINTKKVLGSTIPSLRWGLISDAVLTTFISFLIAVGLTAMVAESSLRGVVVADFTLANNILIYVFSALLALAIGVFAGVYPAKYTTSFAPALVLKGSFGLSPKGRLLRKILISVQFVIAISLVATAILIHRQNKFMQNSDLGLDKENVAVVTISAKTWEKFDAIDSRLKALPEVIDVAYSVDKICAGDRYQNWGMGGLNDKEDPFQSTVIPVSWNFLSVMNIPIIEGREPLKSDENKEDYMFIFNRYAAESEEVTPGMKNGSEVIGICENVQIFSMRKEMGNMAFAVNKWIRSSSCYGYVKLRKGTDLNAAVSDIRKAYAEIDPLVPLEIEFFDGIMDTQYKSEIQMERTINWLSILAVIISMMGIFGVIFFDTQQRKKEIAVRRILGADEKSLLWNFNRSYLVILVICFIAAIPLIFYITNIWLKNFAYHTNLTVTIFFLAFIIVTLITVLTINLQAVSAVRKNPAESIKAE